MIVIAGHDPAIHAERWLAWINRTDFDSPGVNMDRRVKPGGDETIEPPTTSAAAPPGSLRRDTSRFRTQSLRPTPTAYSPAPRTLGSAPKSGRVAGRCRSSPIARPASLRKNSLSLFGSLAARDSKRACSTESLVSQYSALLALCSACLTENQHMATICAFPYLLIATAVAPR